MTLCQAAEAPQTNEPRSTPALSDAPALPAEQPTKTTPAVPKRVHHVTTAPSVKTPHLVKIAYSANGLLIAIANGNPTMILQGRGINRIKDDW